MPSNRTPRLSSVCGRVLAAALLAAAVSASSPAGADGKLDARYAVTVTGINIGNVEWTVDIGSQNYISAASGRASGPLSAVVSGEGVVAARGAIKYGRLSPETFSSSIVHDDNNKSETKMVLDHGDVKTIEGEADKDPSDRLPLTVAHKQGVIDPASALLIPMPGAVATVTKDACKRTLPIFDGRRRYDVALTFKRMDQIKAEKGYAGPVAVCSVVFRPQAGHHAASRLVKYLTAGHDIEMWFAPVSGAHVLAPIRASVASMFGSLVIEAKQFDVATQTAAVAPAKR